MLQVSLTHLKPRYSCKPRIIVLDAYLKKKKSAINCLHTPQGHQYECQNCFRLWWRGPQGILFALNWMVSFISYISFRHIFSLFLPLSDSLSLFLASGEPASTYLLFPFFFLL